jgi:hypothetical protein
MKRKNIFLGAIISASFFIAACGGNKSNQDGSTDSTQNKKTAEDVCVNENTISMTVQGYEGVKDSALDIVYPKFEVKASSFTMKSDSLAEFKLMNYKHEELVGKRKPEQIDIEVELHSKKGKLLQPGVYEYHEYQSEYFSMVKIITFQGAVWFNWSMGMPKTGNVTVDFIDNDNVCGSFNLNVDAPKNKNMGVVRLNGTFSIFNK